MTRKIFVAMILAFAIVVAGGQSSKVEAAEVYVGSYSDGTAVYLLTHTVRINKTLQFYLYSPCGI